MAIPYSHFCLSIIQLMDIYLCCFYFLLLWILLLWTFMYKLFVWTLVFNSLGCIPRSGIADPYDIMFNFWRRHSFLEQQHHFIYPLAMYENSNFSTSSLTLIFLSFPFLSLSLSFLIIAMLEGGNRHLTEVLVCISQMSHEIEHL